MTPLIGARHGACCWGRRPVWSIRHGVYWAAKICSISSPMASPAMALFVTTASGHDPVDVDGPVAGGKSCASRRVAHALRITLPLVAPGVLSATICSPKWPVRRGRAGDPDGLAVTTAIWQATPSFRPTWRRRNGPVVARRHAHHADARTPCAAARHLHHHHRQRLPPAGNGRRAHALAAAAIAWGHHVRWCCWAR